MIGSGQTPATVSHIDDQIVGIDTRTITDHHRRHRRSDMAKAPRFFIIQICLPIKFGGDFHGHLKLF